LSVALASTKDIKIGAIEGLPVFFKALK
jgi:hypothetical protein